MTRALYDSTNILDIPLDAQLVGFYIDGIYAISEAAARSRFPQATLVPISAIGTNAGIVGDVEPGCMTPQEAVAWVGKRRAIGLDPTIYCNQMHGWIPVRFAFRSVGIPEPHYWVANYDGVASIPVGAVAKQYANPTLTGAHYDLSVVADSWPGVDGLYGPSEEAIGAFGARKTTMVATINSLHVFARGTPTATGDRSLFHRRFSGGAWGGWQNLGGNLTTDTISAAVDSSGIIHVVIVGGAGEFFERTSSDDGVNWTNYVSLAGGGDGLILLAPTASGSGGLTAPQSQQLSHIETMLTSGLKGN